MPWEFSAEVQQRVGFDRLPASPGDVTDFISRSTSFENLASMRAERVNLTGGGEPERVGGVRVSRNFLETLGVQPHRGRSFSETDGVGERAVLISYGLWQRRFGARDDAVGRAMSVNGETATIVGVLPAWFRFPAGGELPTGLGYSPNTDVWSLDLLTPEQQRNRGGKSFSLVGRLREDVTLQAAEAELGRSRPTSRQFPASNAGWTVRVVPLREQLVGGMPRTRRAADCRRLALLIACANVANSVFTRDPHVSAKWLSDMPSAPNGAAYPPTAGRACCCRWRLARLTVLGWWGLGALLRCCRPDSRRCRTPRSTARARLHRGRVDPDRRHLRHLPRAAAPSTDVVEGLREGGRVRRPRRAHRTRNALVVAVEVALAAVLLIGASLLIQTFLRLLHVDTGFRADGLLTMEVTLPRTVYPGNRPPIFRAPGGASRGGAGRRDRCRDVQRRLAGTENLRQITIDGRPRPQPGQEIIADFRIVTSDYFRTMGIPQLSGDPLPRQPRLDGAPTLIINALMADAHFPGENPVGRRIKLTSFDQDAPWFTIAGVVGDTRHTALDSAMRPQVYVHQNVEALRRRWSSCSGRDDPSGFGSVARAAVHELDSNQPVGAHPHDDRGCRRGRAPAVHDVPPASSRRSP